MEEKKGEKKGGEEKKRNKNSMQNSNLGPRARELIALTTKPPPKTSGRTYYHKA